MRYAGKICGVFTAGILGSLIFMAPDTISGDALFADLETGKLPATATDTGKAAATRAIAREFTKIEVADDAYFEAVIAQEAATDTAGQRATIELADDTHLEARMKPKASDETGDLLARIDAVNDAYFKAVMALEGNIVEHGQLAELKASEMYDYETVVAQIEAIDPSVTGSLPPVSAMDDLEDRITEATLPMRPTDAEPANQEYTYAPIALYDNLPPEGMPDEGKSETDPATQDMASSFPAAGPPDTAASAKADLETVRMAKNAPEVTVAATPAEKAERMPAPDMHAVARDAGSQTNPLGEAGSTPGGEEKADRAGQKILPHDCKRASAGFAAVSLAAGRAVWAAPRRPSLSPTSLERPVEAGEEGCAFRVVQPAKAQRYPGARQRQQAAERRLRLLLKGHADACPSKIDLDRGLAVAQRKPGCEGCQRTMKVGKGQRHDLFHPVRGAAHGSLASRDRGPDGNRVAVVKHLAVCGRRRREGAVHQDQMTVLARHLVCGQYGTDGGAIGNVKLDRVACRARGQERTERGIQFQRYFHASRSCLRHFSPLAIGPGRASGTR